MSETGLNGPDVKVDASDERALARLLDDVPDAVIVVNSQGLLQWANRTAESLLGRTIADSIGVSGVDLVHPDDLELALRSLASVQKKNVGMPIEIRLRTAGGWRARGQCSPSLRK